MERLQKHAVRTYLRDYDLSYGIAMEKCNLTSLCSRRGASCIVSLLKYQLCSHHILPGFFAPSCEIGDVVGLEGIGAGT